MLIYQLLSYFHGGPPNILIVLECQDKSLLQGRQSYKLSFTSLSWIIARWYSMKESFYYCTTLNLEILAALVFQLEVYYKVDRVLTDHTA